MSSAKKYLYYVVKSLAKHMLQTDIDVSVSLPLAPYQCIVITLSERGYCLLIRKNPEILMSATGVLTFLLATASANAIFPLDVYYI